MIMPKSLIPLFIPKDIT